MSKKKSDALFQLIKSLKKSEKRYFQLFASTEEHKAAKKYIRLFNLIDQQEDFDEEKILAKEKTIKRVQLSNLKAHLYKKILQTLKLYHASAVSDIQIRELIDYAQLLFNRSLYGQCVKVLQKAKKLAHKNDNLELLLEILKWEKNVLSYTVARDNQKRVNNIISEVQDVNNRINNINSFSNLQVKLNSLYLKIGFIRNRADYNKTKNFFHESMPEFKESALSFTEKLSLYSLNVEYYYFIQDFDMGYLFAKKWVDLFQNSKPLILSKLDEYIKGLNHLMTAQYRLFKYHEFIETKRKLKALRIMQIIDTNENIRLKLFKYTYVHEFNGIFMLGDFERGVNLMNKIKPGLEQFIDQLDHHSRIILFYKIACLYFGNGDYKDVVVWLNKIINFSNVDIREDVHSFARILNLISHYELGNTDVLDYYVRSTYRFLLKKDDLNQYQKYILSFLKKLSMSMTDEALTAQFIKLRKQLLPLSKNPFEKRAFIYFDIISWLESKIEKRTIKDIIKEKAMKAIQAEVVV